MLPAIALGLWLALGPQEPAPDPAPPAPERGAVAVFDPAAALAELVDLRFPEARRAEAAALARGHGDVALWMRAMENFGAFEASPPGIHAVQVPLSVQGKTEMTELWVYVPAKYDPHVRAPLMVTFHGTGGSGQGMHLLWQSLADEIGMLVLAPSEAGENTGYRFSDRERAAALEALRWMRRRFNVDENRIYVSGISRGGHLCWDLVLRFPDLFAAAAPCIGSPRLSLTGGQNNMRYLENAAALPIRDLQGSKDDEKLVASVRLAFELLRAFHPTDAQLIEFQDRGHDFDPTAVDWKAWLGGAVRDPWPARSVRCSAAKDENRAAWLEIAGLDKHVEEIFRPKIEQGDFLAMDESAQWRFFVKEAVERNARVVAHRREPGAFSLELTRATKVRLYLRPEDLANGGKLAIHLRDKVLQRRARPDAKVLLEQFAERFDRSFLPVAQVEVP